MFGFPLFLCEQGTDPPKPCLVCQHTPCDTLPSQGEEQMPWWCIRLACGRHSKVPPGARLQALP